MEIRSRNLNTSDYKVFKEQERMPSQYHKSIQKVSMEAQTEENMSPQEFKEHVLNTQREILRAWWITKNVYALCLYYFKTKLFPGQIDIVRAIAFDERPRTTITCTTRYGKSMSVALGLLLWIMRQKKGRKARRLRLLAPSDKKTAIIREYMVEGIMICPALMLLLDTDKTGRERIKKEVSRQRMTWKNGVDFRTLSADKQGKGKSLMGWGGDKVVSEEIGEMPMEVWPKIHRMLADDPNSVYAEIGNPWDRDGPMYAHWTAPDDKWFKIHIGWEQAVKEGRFTMEYMEEVKNDPMLTQLDWTVLWEAKFPKESEDQLIPYEQIRKAQREAPYEIFEKADIRTIGVDVGATGRDLTVITKGVWFRSLYAVDSITSFGKADNMTTVGKIMAILQKDSERIDQIVVDANGWGAGVYDRLVELKREGEPLLQKTRIIAFYGGNKPDQYAEKGRYHNKKAQIGFQLAFLFEKGNIIIPNHQTLVSELGKMKWEIMSSGKKLLKDPGEKSGDLAEKKSPDFAHSLMYATYKSPKIVF